jgi:hypothetical protein
MIHRGRGKTVHEELMGCQVSGPDEADTEPYGALVLFVSRLTVSVRLPELPSVLCAVTFSKAEPLGFQSLREMTLVPVPA